MKNRLSIKEREAIGTRLRAIRHSKKMEQTEFASKLGMSQAIISQYEKGLTEISSAVIIWLGNKWHVSADWLLMGKGEIEISVAMNLSEGGRELVRKLTEQVESLPKIASDLREVIATISPASKRKKGKV